jgi:hypothetical protein
MGVQCDSGVSAAAGAAAVASAQIGTAASSCKKTDIGNNTTVTVSAGPIDGHSCCWKLLELLLAGANPTVNPI